MLVITNELSIPETEIDITAIRARGAGGQNVNKVSTAIHLRFDILASSIPARYKERMQKLNDRRISKDGVVVIKAQRYRSQEKNREEARARLKELLQSIMTIRKKRVATKPSRTAQTKRLDSKTKHGQLKKLRKYIPPE